MTATLRDHAEYALFSLLLRGAEGLSKERALRLGESIGRFGFHRVKVRRAVVEQHLRLAFPDRDEAWIRETAQAAYEHLGRETMQTLRMSKMRPDEVLSIVHHEIGRERFYEAVDAGRGVVLVGGHFGNWELGAATIAANGRAVDAVYQRQRNPLFNDSIVKARQRLGLRLIDRRVATRQALASLREGRTVGFVADQNAGRNGVFVPFFGRLASTHRGPALLAIRSGAPMFFGAAVRQGDHYLGLTEEITVNREGDLDQVVARLTAAFTSVLERLVREYPGQYFWHHRRWKTRPPEEPNRT